MRIAPRAITRLGLTVLIPACAASAVAGGVSGSRAANVPVPASTIAGNTTSPSLPEATDPSTASAHGVATETPTNSGASSDTRGAATGTSDIAIAPGVPEAPRSGTVVFGGDIVPHGELLASFDAHGPESLYAPILPVIRAADIALLNFETPAAPSHPVNRSGLRFNVHADFVRALVAAGFDGASVANNHSYDLGLAPVGETITTLREAGLRPIGGALARENPLEPTEFPLAGGTLCVFAATRILNYYIAPRPVTEARIAMARGEIASEQSAMIDAVHAHRAHCGGIIVSLHTGVEYQDRPEPIDRIYFRRLAEAGADVVVGHHSHTPQPVDVFETGGRRVPFFFSLGNFVSNQGYSVDANVSANPTGHWHIGLDPRVREGLLAILRFEAAEHGRLRLAEFGYVPLWTVNTHLQVASGEAPNIAAALMPRDGGGDHMLQERWQGLVRRAGAEYLLPATSLPGGTEGYRLSEVAVLANRRGTPGPMPATTPVLVRAATPGRSLR